MHRIRSLLYFAVVGVTGIAVNLGVHAGMTDGLGVNYLLGAAIATQFSTTWNFSLSELWVFRGRSKAGRWPGRLAMFAVLNNAALLLRGPIMFVLTDTFGLYYLLSSAVSLLALFVVRYFAADNFIWRNRGGRGGDSHKYDIHGVVAVESTGELPDLAHFRVAHLGRPADITIARGDDPSFATAGARELRYVDGLPGLGFRLRLQHDGSRFYISVSKLLLASPHVLFSNVVEPLLRWSFVERDCALVHAACLTYGDRAFLVTGPTDRGKTATLLSILDRYDCGFLSDDLTLVRADRAVLPFPKPVTISRAAARNVRTPLFTRRERIRLFAQSFLYTRHFRRLASRCTGTPLPTGTINALVHYFFPPPRFSVQQLIPGIAIPSRGRLEGMFLIEAGVDEDEPVPFPNALARLAANCQDAFGLPLCGIDEFILAARPDLAERERTIIAEALAGCSAMVVRSATRDWAQRIPPHVDRAIRMPSAPLFETVAWDGNGRV